MHVATRLAAEREIFEGGMELSGRRGTREQPKGRMLAAKEGERVFVHREVLDVLGHVATGTVDLQRTW